jgi:leukotriene-A4 hydrolase
MPRQAVERNANNRVDHTSLSNPSEACWSSLHLDLTVDFDSCTLSGKATMGVEVRAEGASEFVLDTKELTIKSVHVDGSVSQFKQDPTVGCFGEALRIPVPERKRQEGAVFSVQIEYSTSPESSACQWLPKEQTSGKTRPYLFTQCQAIHARALLPCQDSPGAKVPYTAKLRAPSWSQALMSAVYKGKSDPSGGVCEFTFEQPLPVSAYLIAIAVGDLESRRVGPRSHVWSEPNMVRVKVAYLSPYCPAPPPHPFRML